MRFQFIWIYYEYVVKSIYALLNDDFVSHKFSKKGLIFPNIFRRF